MLVQTHDLMKNRTERASRYARDDVVKHASTQEAAGSRRIIQQYPGAIAVVQHGMMMSEMRGTGI